MKLFFNKYSIIILLLAVSFGLHFWQLNQPHEIVFDELYFGSFVNHYFTHTLYFDIHPPLGKLMIAGVAKLAGFSGTSFDFKSIGEDYGTFPVFLFRFLPALAGSFFTLIIFFFIRSLRGSYFAANLGALFVTLDNALLMQSHYIFVDMFLLAFGFLGLGLFAWSVWRKPKHPWIFWILGAALLGCAASIKWTGLGFAAPAFLLVLYYYGWQQKKWKQTIGAIMATGGIMFLLYFSFFAIHFALLTPYSHTESFQSFYGVNFWQLEDFAPASFLRVPWRYVGEFLITNKEMWQANQSLDNSHHPYASSWYQWPVMQKPLFEWIKNTATPGITQRIYLIGNPVTWFLSFGALCVLVVWAAALFLQKKPIPHPFLFLALGYLINWLPFVLIARPMFLYHYLSAMVFSLLILIFFVDYAWQKSAFPLRLKIGALVLLIVLVGVGFYQIMPLTYGLPAPDSALFKILL